MKKLILAIIVTSLSVLPALQAAGENTKDTATAKPACCASADKAACPAGKAACSASKAACPASTKATTKASTKASKKAAKQSAKQSASNEK